MKTSITVLSALFASCGAVQLRPQESTLLGVGTNVRVELQNSLRSYLDGVTDGDVAKVEKNQNPVDFAGGAENGDYYNRYEVVTPEARSAAVTGMFNSNMAEYNAAEAKRKEEEKKKDDGEKKDEKDEKQAGKEEAVSPVPGQANKALQPFEREARTTELRFGKRVPYERYPNWILPGSVAILPKKSADLNMWDDELDMQGNFHYMSDYNPARELYVQLPEETNVQIESSSQADVRAELQHKLRSFLNGPMANYNGDLTHAYQHTHPYPYDRYPNTVLPGSVAIMPQPSAPLDLFDGAYDDQYHLNHNAVYHPRSHNYNP